MARLTRQFCINRKGDLISLCNELATSVQADIEVRSAAAHIAVMNIMVLRGLRHPASALGGRQPEDVIQRVLDAGRAALELGVAPDVDAFFRNVLSAHGKSP